MARHPFFTSLPLLPFFLESRPPDKAALYWRGGHSPLTYDRLARASDSFRNTLSEELQYRVSIRELSHTVNERLESLSPSTPQNGLLKDRVIVRGSLLDPSVVYERLQPRIAFICESNDTYITSLYAVWKMGGIAVPLCKSHPQTELEYVLRDCGASLILLSNAYKDVGHKLHKSVGVPHMNVNECLSSYDDILSNDSRDTDPSQWMEDASVWSELGAMLVYTSGTTGHPKGVLLTHSNFRYHVLSLLSAWHYSEDDVVLHALPLHHVHGILNILLSPLACGASVVMHEKFEPGKAWSSLLNEKLADECLPQVNVFSGVPTMYNRLLQHYDAAGYSNEEKERIRNHCQSKIRLMMSGSSALPDTIFKRWKEVTGHTLLERYGMTEAGMVLSHLYKGHREPGTVGYPLPYNNVRLVQKDSSKEVEEGELHLYGPGIFKGYWKKPEATKNSFTVGKYKCDDEPERIVNWFVTGDIAECKNNVYKILGRASVDILKSGGYKISALEIERVLLEHSSVSECAVIGRQDDDLGQKIVAIVVPKATSKLTVEAMREWCTDNLAQYKVPREFIIKDNLPRNAMGKVNKKYFMKKYSKIKN